MTPTSSLRREVRRHSPAVRAIPVVAILLVAALLFAACEDTVHPIIESDRQLTLWGTFDMNADRQYLRVVPIREILDVRISEAPELNVTSTDLDLGEQVEWRDSTIIFQNGNPGLLFFADLKVVPTHTYRIEVSSPELPLVTSAETTIPAIPEAEIFPERVLRFVSPSGFTISGLQDLTWHDVRQYPYQIEHWYRFLEFGNLGFIDYKLPFIPPEITYNPGLDDLDMTLNLVRHRDSIQKYINLAQVRLVGLGQTITVLDDAFVPPGGVFDPELLAQPGTMSNVENGFGFLGAVGRFSIEWMISDSSAALMSFVPLSGYRIPKTGSEDPGAEASGVEVGRTRAKLSAHPWAEEPAKTIPEPARRDLHR